MNPASRPDAVPFAPGSGELPPPLGPALTDPDTHLLLIVSPDGGDPAVRTAIGLAEARAAEGLQTVLADAGFADPRVHQLLDVPNVEGLADVFEFGASLGRVMTRPDTRRFDFVAAGAYVPEPEAILASPRWERMVEELAGESVALLVFVPYDTPGLEALSRQADGAILVGDERSVERAASALDPSCEVVAVVEPVGAMAPARLSAEAGEADRVDAATIFDDPELTEPVVFRSDKRKRRILPIVLAILLLAALAAGGWFAYQEYFAGATSPGSTPSAAQTAPSPESQPEPEPVETAVGFSVAVEAHQDLDAAYDRLARLRRAESDVAFYLAPVSINGSLFYRVLAGPVADRDAGMTLMRYLVDRGHKTAFDNWAVRPTTYAFLLGEFETREEAEQRQAALQGREIPAYVVPIRYRPSGTRYRVYGGAFENRSASAVMDRMLADAGIDAPLVARVGVPTEVSR